MKAQNPKVLIIEDEKTLLKTWAQKFEAKGMTVYTAQDGEKAIKTAFTHKPDMVVIDLVMPSTDGLTFVKKLREDKWGSNVPVMFLNSWMDPEEFDEPGVREYQVEQNWSLDQVIRKVAQKLEMLKFRAA